ncbi:hypothetical protein ACL02T_10385 [Pseudonocardia sp. RS010]|uniref:hypothetical protein n=1 Tax=Pseudonocardia sp. RS010 TaxID=3385979 RepID=UPI0039A186EE
MLGGLEANEHEAFLGHLGGCADCQAEVAELTPVVRAIAAVRGRRRRRQRSEGRPPWSEDGLRTEPDDGGRELE